ncbi:MAG: CpsD/CapB family tyrosine-protein kinase [Candidatus Thiodiazotropha sp.]
MEKIKQALEKARMAHTVESLTIRDDKQKKRKMIASEINNIVYTQTKTFKYDEKYLRDRRVITGHTSELISDQYKVLRTQVTQRMKANQWNTLAITSPNEGCGKTITSINLSMSLARDVNHSVLLVDMDLRRPSVHTYFYSNEEFGISDYFDSNKELNEIFFNPGIERLVILPGNRSIANSSEMLSSPITVTLVNELKNRYPNRLVIYDMPPLLSCDDVIAFAPYVDAVMLVVEDEMTTNKDIKRSYELLEKFNVLGVVLNKSKNIETTSRYY